MVRCNEVERAVFKCPMSRQDWELLEKYAKKYKDKESGQFAQDMLDMKRGNQTPDEDMEEDDVLIEGIYEEETIPFAELEDDEPIIKAMIIEAHRKICAADQVL